MHVRRKLHSVAMRLRYAHSTRGGTAVTKIVWGSLVMQPFRILAPRSAAARGCGVRRYDRLGTGINIVSIQKDIFIREDTPRKHTGGVR